MSRVSAFLKDPSGATAIEYSMTAVGLSITERRLERPMRKLILQFLCANAAATSIEYALIAAGISIFVLGAVNTVGAQLSATFYGPLASAL
jgi:pilus assembly protein Flp/PilA